VGVYGILLIFVWLRDKISVGGWTGWCCDVVGSCDFLLPRSL